VFDIGRRDFITLLGGAAAAWPLAARAQHPERMRRIGVLMNRVADDPEAQARLKALVQGLQQLGWVEGRNVRMDVRWTAGIADHVYRHAAELVALMPDVILADGAVGVSALQGRPHLMIVGHDCHARRPQLQSTRQPVGLERAKKRRERGLADAELKTVFASILLRTRDT
jgi:hypothetical protein